MVGEMVRFETGEHAEIARRQVGDCQCVDNRQPMGIPER